ncbi:hypothetical protein WJX81_007498, partial [Elliptochloris bilobata]
MAPHAAFELLGGERYVALAPGETQPISVVFRPGTIGRHLQAGTEVVVTASFHSDTRAQLPGSAVALKLIQINFKGTNLPLAWFAAAAAAEAPPAANAEPEYSVVAKSEKELTVKVWAAADAARYECAGGAIAFRPTLMFQSRSFAFTLRNAGATHLPFRWAVRPESGTLAPGEESAVQVHFSPQEVLDCDRMLVADLPDLADGLPALRRALTGSVLRPWCHFELPASTYLAQGVRPESSGGAKVTSVLDSNTKVLEIASLGIKVRNTKRTEMAFEFAPSSPEPLEALWRFRAPSCGVDVLLLV